MIPIASFAGKTVAVFGLARTGGATARALMQGGAAVIAFDDNGVRVEEARAQGLPVQDLRKADWGAIDALVLSPGVPLTHPQPHWTVDLAHHAGVPVIGDLELFCMERRRLAPSSPLIAITGTNGKSTTTALIAHLLAEAGADAAMGGNIGEAILTLPPPAPARHHVLECSSFQIDLAPGIDPFVGIHLNLTPDHLDRHGTMENYAAVKERLITGVQENGTAIVGVDDSYSAAIADRAERAGKHVLRVSVRNPVTEGVTWAGGQLILSQAGADTPLFGLDGIETLRGAHNGQNAAAAAAAMLTLGFSTDTIERGMRGFKGLAHRMEPVARIGRVRFVNDSKATNAESAKRALRSYGNVFWIAGGLAKEGGLGDMTDFLPHIAKAYLIGEAAEDFALTLKDGASFTISKTLDVALGEAARDAASSGLPEPTVLLSPACASFDQFKDFEARGDAFRSMVLALVPENGAGPGA